MIKMLDNRKIKRIQKEINKKELERIASLEKSLAWRINIMDAGETTNILLSLESIQLIRQALLYYAAAIKETET